MQLDFNEIGDALVVSTMENRIDASTAGGFKEKMIHQVQEGHGKIVLDLSGVGFIDSSGLSAILAILKRLGGKGEMVICGVGESLMTLFQLTRMNRIFRFFLTRDEAIGALTG